MKNLALLVTSIIFSLVLCEVGLRLFTPFPVTEESNKTDDPVLGYRLSTHLDDVDQHGFRNRPKETYDIAALGDSHTYGNNVSSDQTWSALLGDMTGMKVYNYGVGSYGIFTYHAILKTLVKPDARGVIIALYPANDFKMTNSLCPANSAENTFMQDEIKSLNLEIPPAETLRKHCAIKIGGKFSGLKKHLFDDSAIVSAIKLLVIKKTKQRLKIVENDSNKFYIFDGHINPVPKSQTRNSAKRTDMQNPDTKYMFETFDKFMGSWRNWAHDNNVKLGVLIIPSVERVIYEYYYRKNGLELLDAGFVSDLLKQIKFEQSLSALLDKHEINYKFALSDTVDAFIESLQDGHDFYPVHDSHPKEEGYQAYARAAYELWEDMNH